MDAADMEMVRVKTLHFRYPERYGRRQVKLETLMDDEQFAILKMIQSHMSEESVLSQGAGLPCRTPGPAEDRGRETSPP